MDAGSKRAATLWIVLLAQGVLLVWLACGEEHAEARGVTHPRFEQMRAAPAGAARLDELALPFAAYGVTIVLALITILGLGFRDARGKLHAPRAFGFACVAFFAAFVWLWIARAEGPGPFGLSSGTFALLFGVWPAEALFVVAFVVGFRRGYWTPESEARFRALLEKRRASTKDAS